MVTFEIKERIGSNLAIDYSKARAVANDIIGSPSKWGGVELDFSGIVSIISPFARELIGPIRANSIKYKITWVASKDHQELIERIEEESASGMINFRSIE